MTARLPPEPRSYQDPDSEPFSDLLLEKHALDRRREAEERGYLELSPEWETRAAISAILEITTGAGSFKVQLGEILDVIVSISWLRAAKQGAIFVANAREELVLVVHHALAPQLKTLCAKVPFGHCLCGRAAQQKRLLFKTCVDDEHETRFDGMRPHGHYNVPLLDKDRVIGVMVLYIEHGHEPHPEELHFMEMLGRTVSGFLLNRSLTARAEVNGLRLKKAQQEMVQKLVAASEYRDNETGAHIQRMSQYAVILGRAVGLDRDQLRLLEQAAPMHDIGKVGIADQILLKPGRLSDAEFSVMKEHATIGGDLLTGDHPLLEASRQIALTHHERWDGKGYPNGLAGAAIPLFGRICALADVFDALTSERPYKEAWPVERAVQYVTDNAGAHFDPVLVEAFVDNLTNILEVKSFYEGAAGEPGVVGTRLPEAPVDVEFVRWDDSLSVGVSFVDHQHRYLINLINRIHGAIEASNTEEITEALLDMKTYADVHFREEEQLMADAGYPGLGAHRRQHADFIRQTNAFLDELENYPLAIGTETSMFLRTWLVEHIQVADQGYARFLDRVAE